MPDFEVGVYVLVYRVKMCDDMEWVVACGFRRVSSCVQRTRHRDRRYKRSSRREDAVSAKVQGLFEMTKHQGEYKIHGILNIGKDPLKAGDYKV